MRMMSALVLGASLAGTAAADPIVVPTEMCRGYFFVPVSLAAREGYPDDRVLWFLYDTGASTTYVDPEAIERVSGRSMAGLERVTITGATAGPVNYNRLPARLSQLDHLSIALGREIDGILAYDGFDDYLVTLDYAAGQIRLDSGRLPRPDGQTVFSARGPDDRPWLEVEFPNRTRRMLIDSGAGATIFAVNDIERYPLTEPPRPVTAATRFNRMEYRDGSRIDGEVRLGPHILPSPQVEDVPQTELIGGEVMRFFTWTFDFERERVSIEPRTGLAVTFPPEPALGLSFRPVADGLHVEAVLDGAADGIDILPGDVITHWNGRPVRARGCDTLAAGEVVTLTRVRGGQSAVVDVPVVVLVE
ncbi:MULTISPECIES: hypothetical protein [Hyphobacterium]|uniref:PDZ domain-containing protein n=1 Tax=Hyphobacterium vulgare TaxID=1736751 RepID=A0ABV6ZZR6_9PROT